MGKFGIYKIRFLPSSRTLRSWVTLSQILQKTMPKTKKWESSIFCNKSYIGQYHLTKCSKKIRLSRKWKSKEYLSAIIGIKRLGNVLANVSWRDVREIFDNMDKEAWRSGKCFLKYWNQNIILVGQFVHELIRRLFFDLQMFLVSLDLNLTPQNYLTTQSIFKEEEKEC